MEELERIKVASVIKSIKDYDIIINNDDLNTLTEQGLVCAEPFYMTKNRIAREHYEKLWIPTWCNTLILLQGGNLKSIVGRTHCRAILRGHTNNNWHPIIHKKKGLWCWKIDKRFKYVKYTWECNTTLLLWEQLDVWYTLKKNWVPLTKYDGKADFEIDFDFNINVPLDN